MNPEPSQPTVVVVDDDPGLVALLVEALGDAGYRVEGHADPLAAIEAAVTGDVDTLITDVRMRDLDGLEVCRSMAQRRADVPVIVLTAFGSLDTAVRAMRAGAFDFLSKPIDLDALELAVARAVEHHRLTCEVTRLRQAVDEQLPDGLVGESLPMQHLNERLRRAARADVPVLLTGETGTGKELAARTLLGLSERAQAPFVAVNCAALPEPLLESELFGHVRGAFTDARTARAGLFVEAGEGVIFLDEVGEMPLGLQPKLLRALQERAVRPVGADRPVPIKCRVISATNRDLKAEVSAGRFRSDLYYRLAVIRLDLPPLRLRGPDILTLAQHFLRRSATRLGRSTKGLSRPVAAALLAYDWPGNVRELENCIEQGVAMTEHDHLVLDDLPEEVRGAPQVAPEGEAELLPLEAVERAHIRRVMAAVSGNKSMAAQVLGVDRSTLYRKLEKLADGDDDLF